MGNASGHRAKTVIEAVGLTAHVDGEAYARTGVRSSVRPSSVPGTPPEVRAITISPAPWKRMSTHPGVPFPRHGPWL